MGVRTKADEISSSRTFAITASHWRARGSWVQLSTLVAACFCLIGLLRSFETTQRLMREATARLADEAAATRRASWPGCFEAQRFSS
jgi:hypothetical protein